MLKRMIELVKSRRARENESPPKKIVYISTDIPINFGGGDK